MNRTLLIPGVLTVLLTFHQSCGNLSKLASDKIVAAAIRNKHQEIIEAVKFSIGITYNSHLRSFAAAGVKDSIMRKKIESLGSVVYVKYQKDNAPASLPDSTVVFTSFQDIGTIETIFDFATHERNLASLIEDDKKYYLRKVGERTYYRRGPQSGGSDYAE